MEEGIQHPTRPKRLAVALGAMSLVASIASLYTSSRHGHWHEELRRLHTARTTPPEWLTWGFVDSLQTASVALALVALPLAAISAFGRVQPVATAAVLLALLALLTALYVI